MHIIYKNLFTILLLSKEIRDSNLDEKIFYKESRLYQIHFLSDTLIVNNIEDMAATNEDDARGE